VGRLVVWRPAQLWGLESRGKRAVGGAISSAAGRGSMIGSERAVWGYLWIVRGVRIVAAESGVYELVNRCLQEKGMR